MVYRRFGAPVSAAIVGLVVSGTANADGCSNRTVSGSYGAQLTGSAVRAIWHAAKPHSPAFTLNFRDAAARSSAVLVAEIFMRFHTFS